MARKAAVEDLELEDDFEVEEEEEQASAPAKKKAAPKGVGARQIAESVGADPKTFRAWLRRMVESGEIEIDREAKSRYNFGNTLNSPMAKRVVKLWNNSSHERGRKAADSDEDE